MVTLIGLFLFLFFIVIILYASVRIFLSGFNELRNRFKSQKTAQDSPKTMSFVIAIKHEESKPESKLESEINSILRDKDYEK
jgi:hypothetical protein